MFMHSGHSKHIEVRGQFVELVQYLHYVGPKDQIEIDRLDDKPLYPLSHVDDSMCAVFYNYSHRVVIFESVSVRAEVARYLTIRMENILHHNSTRR